MSVYQSDDRPTRAEIAEDEYWDEQERQARFRRNAIEQDRRARENAR